MGRRTAIPAIIGVVAMAGLASIAFLARRYEAKGEPSGTQATGSKDAAKSRSDPLPSPPRDPDGAAAGEAWASRFDELSRQLKEAARRGDLDALTSLSRVLQKEAPSSARSKVQLLIAESYRAVIAQRGQEMHAPPKQTLTEAEARQLLETLRSSGDPGQRAAALKALMGSRLPADLLGDAQAAIRDALTKTPPETHLLSLLNSFVDAGASAALLEYSKPPFSKDVRKQALRVLADRSWSTSEIESGLAALRSETDPDLRAAWLTALSARGGAAAAGTAQTQLADPSPQVRAAALLSLDAKQPGDRDILVGAISDPEASVRLRAVTQLSRNIEDSKVLSTVLRSAAYDSSTEVRQAAIRLLLQEPFKSNPEVLAVLRQVSSSDASEDVRLTATNVLKRLEPGK